MWFHSTIQVVFVTLHGDESSPLHCVVPFNHTGYHCNVAGGRLPKKSWYDCHRQSIDFDSLRGAPPLRTHWWVIPFTHTGYNCSAPGTAHRPFPTVSLMGSFLNQRILKAGTSGAQELSIVNFSAVPYGFAGGSTSALLWQTKTAAKAPPFCFFIRDDRSAYPGRRSGC